MMIRTLSSVVFAALVLVGCASNDNSAVNESAASDEEQPLPDYTPVNLTLPVDAANAEGPAAKGVAEATESEGLSLAGGTVSYYMTIYGYQGKGLLNLPRNSHTYAMFIKATGDNLQTAALQTFTVSWLPQDGIVQLGQGVKPGRNYSFEETMQIAASHNFDVRRSIVVRIDEHLYNKAFARKQMMDEGAWNQAIRYKMIDDPQGRVMVLNGQFGGYSNCIHAVSDALIYGNGALLDTGAKRGWAASDTVFQFFSGHMVQGFLPYDALLAPRLGL